MICFLVAASGLGGSARAQITTRRGSEDFAHQYQAASMLDGSDGWELVDNASGGVPWSNVGGILTGSTTTASGGRWLWQHNGNDPWFSEISANSSWTAEFRVTVSGSSSSVNQAGVQLWTGGGGVETLLAINDTGASIGNLSAGGGTTIETGVDNTSSFQTYRLAFDRQTARFFAWHGTALLNPFGHSGYSSDNRRLIVGDGQSSNLMGTAQVEYVRFDPTGAYAPVGGDLPPDPGQLQTIVAFGDSTTAPRNVGAALNGRPLGPSTSHDGTVVNETSPFLYVYADVLRDELPLHGVYPDQVLNRGVGGNRTDQAFARLDVDVRAQDPALVIVQFGINDSWQDAGVGTASRVALNSAEQVGHPFGARGNFTDNLTSIVDALTADEARVVLMTPNKQGAPHPPFRNETLARYAEVVRQVASVADIELVDVWQMYEDYDAVNGQSLNDLLLDGQHPNAAGHRLVADALRALIDLEGDFNLDGRLDCADIDALVATIAQGGHQVRFDLSGDGVVDGADLIAWRNAAGAVNLGPGQSYPAADANLDGVVDTSDFNLWNAHKFTATPAWCGGDFNADGVVDASDFNIWNTAKFTATDATSSVPEPSVSTPCWCLVAVAVRSRWKCRHRVRIRDPRRRRRTRGIPRR